MKIKTTFEDYLRSEIPTAIKDFRIRATVVNNQVQFYIHPQDVNGETLDYLVVGNSLECISETLDL